MKCQFCNQPQEHLITNFNQSRDGALIQFLKQSLEEWTEEKGICSRCLDKMQIRQVLESTASVLDKEHILEVNGYPVLPLPTRLMAHPGFTGKGVTVCYIDSGFILHPDLTQPKNRIKAIIDITNPQATQTDFEKPKPSSWHGTMTTVVGVGNGHLSNGQYKGIASEASLVLIKVMKDEGGISGNDINKALEWILENHATYGIQIVNMSVTDDWPVSYKKSSIAKNIHQLVESGITVVAAAGNDDHAALLPPANVPEAITVGGLNDQNTLSPIDNSLYHSTYGLTIDQIHKPEIIAPAIWIPAPILPETDDSKFINELFEVLEMTDEELINNGHRWRKVLGIQDDTFRISPYEIRQRVKDVQFGRKAINRFYQHADGTSFAAPIICSIIAQMLEANPSLTPYDIREILINTARPIWSDSTERQGFGVVQALEAVNHAASEVHHHSLAISPLLDYANREIIFTHHDHSCEAVHVAGDFNAWRADEYQLKSESEDGIWSIRLPMPPTGTYRYKFIINRDQWISDYRNLYKEPDGFNGFNSKFYIENHNQN